jgi:hypothetical protein
MQRTARKGYELTRQSSIRANTPIRAFPQDSEENPIVAAGGVYLP